jgi:hypothetical protein
MEPISGAIGIAGGAVTLAGLALTISKILTNFVNVHHRSALLIHSLIGACKAIEIAWNSIHDWVETQRNLDSVENSLLDQLMSATEVGKIVLGALIQDLEPYEGAHIGKVVLKLKAGQKLKAVLDEDVFKDHCARLNLQVSSLHLLLATTTLCVICSDRAFSADPFVGRLLEHSPTSVTACAPYFARTKKLRGR